MLEALILGIVQGVTEFIPVSSSGHLVLFHELFGSTGDNLAFDVALHAGTLLAVLIYFRSDLVVLVYGFLKGRTKETNLVKALAIATVPAVVVGLFLNDIIETSLRSPWIVVVMLAVFGGVMLWAESYASKIKKKQEADEIKTTTAVKIGLMQACALIPGVSRSGATISAGLMLGMSRVAATRFSFLLAIPVIFGAAAKTLIDGSVRQQISADTSLFIVGTIAAFLSGLIAIAFLLSFVTRYSIRVFAYYRFVAAGLIAIILVLSR